MSFAIKTLLETLRIEFCSHFTSLFNAFLEGDTYHLLLLMILAVNPLLLPLDIVYRVSLTTHMFT
jgi:hypothetical protein